MMHQHVGESCASRVAVWLFLFACALAGLGVTSPAGAESVGLKRIDFISGVGVTGMDIHSGALLPARTIQESDDKIVVEIDGVSANDPVQTDFSRARNVTNVIFQPQSTQRLRLIIRGNGLGKAQTRFISDAAPTSAVAPAPAPATFMAAALPSAKPASASAQEAQTLLSLDTPIHTTPSPIQQSQELSNQTMPAENAPFQIAESVPTPASDAHDAFDAWLDPSAWMRAIANGDWTAGLIKGLLILGLLGGFTLFIRQKIFNQGPLPEADISRAGREERRLTPLGRGRKRHDDVMGANAGEDDDLSERPGLFSPNRHPKKANVWATRPEPRAPQESPIGLNGLRPRMQQPSQPPATERRPERHDEPRASVTPPAPGRQALQQYRQQQQPQSGNARNRGPGASNAAAALQQAIQGNRRGPKSGMGESAGNGRIPTAAAGKIPASARAGGKAPQSEAIPENTQVLEFLKNVADLMEKNGDADKARRIQKNLRP